MTVEEQRSLWTQQEDDNEVKKQVPTEQGLWDDFKYGYTKNIGMPVANALGRGRGDSSYLVPEKVKKDGIDIWTRDKTLNDYSIPELVKRRDEMLKVKGDDTYYEAMDENNRVKLGFAGKGYDDRYKNNPSANSWTKTMEVQSKNASAVEMMMHGNEEMLKNRAYHREMEHEGDNLVSGYTEIYESGYNKNGIINKPNKDVKRSDIAKESFNKANFALTDKQIEMQNIVVDKESVVTRENFKQKAMDMSVEELVDYATKNNTLNWNGAFSEKDLEFTPAYRSLAKDEELSEFLGLPKGVSSKQEAKNLSASLREYNVDITTLVNKASKLSIMGDKGKRIAKKMYNALEMYDATDLSAKQFVKGVGNAMQDPTNLLGFGVAVKAVGGQVAKKGLKTMLKNIFTGTASRVGATEGALAGSLDSAVKQSVGVMGDQKTFSMAEVGQGAVLGAVLGGSIGKVMDVVMKGKTPTEQSEVVARVESDAQNRVNELFENDPDMTVEHLNELLTEFTEEGLSKEVELFKGKIEEKWQSENPNKELPEGYADAQIAMLSERMNGGEEVIDIPEELLNPERKQEPDEITEQFDDDMPPIDDEYIDEMGDEVDMDNYDFGDMDEPETPTKSEAELKIEAEKLEEVKKIADDQIKLEAKVKAEMDAKIAKIEADLALKIEKIEAEQKAEAEGLAEAEAMDIATLKEMGLEKIAKARELQKANKIAKIANDQKIFEAKVKEEMDAKIAKVEADLKKKIDGIEENADNQFKDVYDDNMRNEYSTKTHRDEKLKETQYKIDKNKEAKKANTKEIAKVKRQQKANEKKLATAKKLAEAERKKPKPKTIDEIKKEYPILQHPRMDELMEMRQGVLAKDALYDNVRFSKKSVIQNIGAEATVNHATDSHNYNSDFVLTKKDIANIKKGKIDDELIEKIETDLGRLDNDPDWALDEPSNVLSMDMDKIDNRITNDFNKADSMLIRDSMREIIEAQGDNPDFQVLRDTLGKKFQESQMYSSKQKKLYAFKEFFKLYNENPLVAKTISGNDSMVKLIDQMQGENATKKYRVDEGRGKDSKVTRREKLFLDLNDEHYKIPIGEREGLGGAYNPKDKTIVVGKDGFNIVTMHELTHAFTHKAVVDGLSDASNATLKGLREFIGSTKMTGYSENSNSNFNYLKKVLSGKYGNKTLRPDQIERSFNDEMLAIFTSNADFRKELYSVYGKKDSKGWKKFVQEVMKSFGRIKRIVEDIVNIDGKSNITDNIEYQKMLRVLDEAVTKSHSEPTKPPTKVEAPTKKRGLTLSNAERASRLIEDLEQVELNYKIKFDKYYAELDKGVPENKLDDLRTAIGRDSNRITSMKKRIDKLMVESTKATPIERLAELKKQLKDQKLRSTNKQRRKKDGTKIESDELKYSTDTIERVTFTLSNPKVRREGDAPISSQTLVPMKSREKGVEYEMGHNIRAYAKDSDKLGTQGGDAQKATHKANVHDIKITDNSKLDAELNRMLDVFDTNSKVKEYFGQNQPSYKNSKGKTLTSDNQRKVNRNQFLINQLHYIRELDSTSPTMKTEISARIKRLRKNPLKEYIPSRDEISKAKEKYYDNYELPPMSKQDMDAYRTEQDARFEVKGPNKKAGERDDRIRSTIEDKVTNGKKLAVEAYKEIRMKEALKARKWNGKVTDEIMARYPDFARDLNGYRNRMLDLDDFDKGYLDNDRLKMREAGRIADETRDNISAKYEDTEGLDDMGIGIETQYRDIGMKQVEANSDVKVKKQDAPTEEQIMEMERKQRIKSTQKNKQVVKTLYDYLQTKVMPRHKKIGTASTGKPKISNSQLKHLDDGMTPQEIADITSPANVTDRESSYVKKANKEASILRDYEKKAKELGIDSSKQAFGEQHKIMFKDQIADASNSAMQMIVVLLGSKRMAKYAKMLGYDLDIRTIVGEGGDGSTTSMSQILANDSRFSADGSPPKSKDPKMKTWKDFVKPIFMTEQYGQGIEGSIKDIMNVHGWDEPKAKAFYDAYDQVIGDMFPEMKALKEAIYTAMENGGTGEFNIKIGKETIHLDLSGTKEVKVTAFGQEFKTKLHTGSIEEKSRALMPTVVHSIDAYVAQQMRALGYHTIHDAFIIPEGKTMADVQKAYGEIMGEINDSNLLEQIGESIGVDLSQHKVGDLNSKDIIDSEYKLSIEHPKGIEQDTQLREKDLGKFQSYEEVMRDFMASSNHRSINSGQLVDSMVAESSFYDMSVAMKSDDPFERQVALAHQSPEYDVSKEIAIPKDQPNLSQKWWSYTQKQIFNEARAKLEYNPLTHNEIGGKNKYFDEYGDIIGVANDDMKAIIDKELAVGKKQLELERDSIMQTMIDDGLTYAEIHQSIYELNKKKALNAKEQTKVIAKEVARQPEKPADLTTKLTPEENKLIDNDDVWNPDSGEPKPDWAKGISMSPKFEKSTPSGIKPEGVSKVNSDFYDQMLDGKLSKGDYKDKVDALLAKAEGWSKPYLNKKVSALRKQMQDDTLYAEEFISATIPERGTEAYKADSLAEYKQYFARQMGTTDASKQFNRLDALTKHTENTSSAREEADLRFWNEQVGDNQEAWTKSILHTDYHAINGLTKTLANQFMKDFDGLYQIVKLQVDRGAEAIGKPENQTGFFENNALGIAKKLNLPLNTVHIIDKMMSIKAMDDASWKFVEKNMYSETFREVMATRQNDKARSTRIFSNNPDSMIKGFIGEFYEGNKTLDENSKVVYDIEIKSESGAIPKDANQGIVGKEVSVEDMHNANTDNLKFRDGKIFGVADTKIREQLGRTNNFARIMSGTSASIERKIAQHQLINKVANMDLTSIMSEVPKDGFVQLPLEALASLPHKLQKKSQFVHKGMYNQLLGKRGMSIVKDSASRPMKMIDKVTRELAKRFARNVVLGNIPSLMNAVMANFTMALVKGISPAKTMRNSIEAMRVQDKLVDINRQIAHNDRVGRDSSLLKRLRESNLLYKMQEAGLATNQVEGLKNNNSFFNEVANEATGGLGFVGTFMSNATLSSKSKLGKGVEDIFSATDTSGRYSMAKEAMATGKTIEEAVLEANGIFGDTAQVAPDLVRFFNSYPVGLQFMTWATQTTPTILKISKDNPVKAIALTLGLWAIKEASKVATEDSETFKGGMRTDSYNPVISTIDFSAQPFLNVYDMIASPSDRVEPTQGQETGESDVRGRNTDVGGLIGASLGAIAGRGTLAENARKIIPYAIPAYIMKPSMNEVNRRSRDKKFNLKREIKRNLVPSAGKLYPSIKGKPIDTRTPSEKLLGVITK